MEDSDNKSALVADFYCWCANLKEWRNEQVHLLTYIQLIMKMF